MKSVAESMWKLFKFKEGKRFEEFEDRFNSFLMGQKNQKKLNNLKIINIIKKLYTPDNLQKKLNVLIYELFE